MTPTIPEVATGGGHVPETGDTVEVDQGATGGRVRIGPGALGGKLDHPHPKEVRKTRGGSAAGTERTAPRPGKGAARTRTG